MNQRSLHARDLHFQSRPMEHTIVAQSSQPVVESFWHTRVHWLASFILINLATTMVLVMAVATLPPLPTHGSFFVVSRVASAPQVLEAFDTVPADPAPVVQPTIKSQAFKAAEGDLLKVASDPTVWLVVNGQRHGFVSAEIFETFGYSFTDIEIISSGQLSAMQQGDLVSNLLFH